MTTPALISMIEVDDWTLVVSADDHEVQVGSIERVMVNSGICLFSMPTSSSRDAILRTASDAQIECVG